MALYLTASIVSCIAYLAIVATLAIVAALRVGGRREDAGDDHDALAVSRFTIPVSVIVPISTGGAAVRRTISALLDLNYPEFEVIVAGDGLSQTVVDELTGDWQLEAREFFYRKTIETAEVRRIYRSAHDSRLMVIDKAAAGSSDTLNCGVNVARYRYFVSVTPDVVFDRDALLRAMTTALRDPAHVVGASSHVERGADADRESGQPDSHTAVGTMTALFQRLSSARSLMDSRLAWRYLGAGFGPSGAVVVWRRDAVIKVNGFSRTAADPVIDMMFRLQTRGEDGGRFDRGADVFGRVSPQPISSALKMAFRRQQSALEILGAAFRGRARALELKTLAYFLKSELLTPFAQLWTVAATLVGAIAGFYSWTSVILAIAVLSFGNAAVSAAALLLRGSSAGAPDEPELRRLLVAGPLEFILYRPALAAARVAAAVSFLSPKR